jgi:hypothetical protein
MRREFSATSRTRVLGLAGHGGLHAALFRIDRFL